MKKYYQLTGMLRAGKPLRVMRGEFTAIVIDGHENTRVVATTNVCAFSRDHTGWPKKFARSTAGYAPHRVIVYTCGAEMGECLAGEIRKQLRPSIRCSEPSVFATPIEFSLPGLKP